MTRIRKVAPPSWHIHVYPGNHRALESWAFIGVSLCRYDWLNYWPYDWILSPAFLPSLEAKLLSRDSNLQPPNHVTGLSSTATPTLKLSRCLPWATLITSALVWSGEPPGVPGTLLSFGKFQGLRGSLLRTWGQRLNSFLHCRSAHKSVVCPKRKTRMSL